MKVKELIELLKTMNPDSYVVLTDTDTGDDSDGAAVWEAKLKSEQIKYTEGDLGAITRIMCFESDWKLNCFEDSDFKSE